MPSRIFIAIFALLTLLPLAQMITGAVPFTPVVENRRLAPAPSLSVPFDRWPRVANEWFNDHFGLRHLLIRLKTQIDYSLFRTSDRVLIGRDGWLFYRSTMNEASSMETVIANKQANIVAGVRMFTEALERNGIRSVLVVNMMSDRFYADKLPAAAIHRPEHPRIDELVEKLRGLKSLHYVDSFAILRETQAQRQVFHKTDFHWNDPAAFPVAKAVVDYISSAERMPASAWTHPLEIELMRSSGGIANFMPLFVPPSENALMVRPTYKMPPGLETKNNVGVFETVTNAPTASNYLPSTVFLGDSFFDGMIRSGIQFSFAATSRARWKVGQKLSDVVREMPADVRWFVIQFIEVNVMAFDCFADLNDVAQAVEIIDRRRSLGKAH